MAMQGTVQGYLELCLLSIMFIVSAVMRASGHVQHSRKATVKCYHFAKLVSCSSDKAFTAVHKETAASHAFQTAQIVYTTTSRCCARKEYLHFSAE